MAHSTPAGQGTARPHTRSSHRLSHTQAHTHTCSHTHCSHSHPVVTQAGPLHLTHTPDRPLHPPPTQAHTHTRSSRRLTHTQARHTGTYTHTLTHTHRLTHTHTLTHTHAHTHTGSHTHTLTHTRTHTHTRSHTHPVVTQAGPLHHRAKVPLSGGRRLVKVMWERGGAGGGHAGAVGTGTRTNGAYGGGSLLRGQAPFLESKPPML